MKFKIFNDFSQIYPHTFPKHRAVCRENKRTYNSCPSRMANTLQEGVGIYYGMTERKDGFMNINDSDDKGFNLVAEGNRNRFIENNIKGELFVPCQVHGAGVKAVCGNNEEEVIADGLITAIPGVTLSITVADCFPVYFYDPVKQVIGIAHCGWRSIVKNIVKNIVYEFKELLSNPKNIYLGIGPGIQNCHFIIKDDIIEQFNDYKDFIKNEGDGSYKVDLEAIVIRQAKEEGIVHIESSGICTYCEPNRYFSYRRDKSVKKVMMAYIGLK